MHPFALAFVLIFALFEYVYPVLQVATLFWGPRRNRLISLALLIPGAFTYIWPKLPPHSHGDLRGIVVFFFGPPLTIAVAILALAAYRATMAERRAAATAAADTEWT